MSFQIRDLTADDAADAWQLGALSFGYHDRLMPESFRPDPPGRRTYGAYDEGRLVAKVVDRDQSHWFGGRLVPAAGVAGVATAPEMRGHGLARELLTRLLAGARERGAAISTLFPTIPFPYRRLGWEESGALTYLRFATSAFASVKPHPKIRLRPATVDDMPAINELYRATASRGNGMLERSGPCFGGTAQDYLDDYHGTTVAVGPDGSVEGYAAWDRGPGYDENGKLTVDDLIGATPEATTSLVAMIGGWTSAAPITSWRVAEDDPALYLISRVGSQLESRQPWMLRMVDAKAAIAARGWPAFLRGQVDLDLEDFECPWNAGPHRLVLEDGAARLEPGGSGLVRLTARAFGPLYAAAATPEQLRRAGLLQGGDAKSDELLAYAFSGPRPSSADYF